MNNKIISYLEMCQREKSSLQKGMNFRLNGGHSVFLMSTRPNSPYRDEYEENGRIIIYEGHDISKSKEIGDPKKHDQPEFTKNGSLTENGKFYQAAKLFKEGKAEAEIIKVYEKINTGIWAYNGKFRLIDAWREYKEAEGRYVFKFKLEMVDEDQPSSLPKQDNLIHSRLIPSWVKKKFGKETKGSVLSVEAPKTFTLTT